MKAWHLLILIVASWGLGILCGGCSTSNSEALRTLQKAGFSEIRPGGRAFFGCDTSNGGDKWGREFQAKNPAGQVVSGIVCCGRFWKGCTIRF
jgi:hypothetical protein